MRLEKRSVGTSGKVSWPPVDAAFPRVAHVLWLATAYWRSRASLGSWPLLLTLIGLQFAMVYVSVWRNHWERSLGDLLQTRDAGAIGQLALSFAGIVAIASVTSVLGIFLTEYTNLRWRAWLTRNYISRWLEDERFLAIERSGLIDNPDQRITEDLQTIPLQLVALLMSLILATTSVTTFVVILWGYSSTLHFAFAGIKLAIPGDLVWAAVLYMLGGSLFIVALGRPLVRLAMRQQKYEANFRYRLINVRRNAEQVSFARAAPSERRNLEGSFSSVYRNMASVILAKMRISAGQTVYSNVETILPLVLIFPRFLSGAISLGVLLQIRAAFGQLAVSLSYFIQAYPTLAQMMATINRLKAFDDAIAAPRRPDIVYATEGDALRVKSLDLQLPDGDSLLRLADWSVNRGERWAITGASGAGKSTLMRAVAGLWPHGTGSVLYPAGTKMMFVAQKPYMPIGSVREALTFPLSVDHFSDEACARVLADVRLARLADHLDETGTWSDALSPGEQQRLAFARVVLQAPDLVFLDEATSALGPEDADAMYRLVLATRPGVTLISIVHGDVLSGLHDRILIVEQGLARQQENEPAALELPTCARI